DMDTASGDLIEIEERDPTELYGIGGQRTVAEGVPAWNPVFDVTPAPLIDATVPENAAVEHPDTASIRAQVRACAPRRRPRRPAGHAGPPRPARRRREVAPATRGERAA